MDDKTTELTVISPGALPTILATPGASDILSSLAAKVAVFRADASTPAGREETRSLAYEIARTKTKLDNIGKDLTEEARKVTSAVNAERKVLRERLEELQERVRAPLTAWENRDKARIEEHEAALRVIAGWADISADTSSVQISYHIDMFDLAKFDYRNWQEFEPRANIAIAATRDTLRKMHADAVKRETEAAELAKLRAEEAERQRIQAEKERAEREARIAQEAAEAAKREAETRAAEEAAQAQRMAEAAQRRLEAEAQAAKEREARAEADRIESEAREKLAQERIEQMRRQKAEDDAKAEAAKMVAAAKAEADAQAAAEAATAAERKRLNDQAATLQAEADARAANIAHRRTATREAVAAVMTIMGEFYGEPDEKCGKTIVEAIARGAIPHVTISY